MVILTDKKEEGKVRGLSKGTTHDIGHLIYSLMAENKKLSHDIYVFACIYAHKHFTAEERDIINAVISAEASKNRKEARNEIQNKTENLCVLHALRSTADRAVKHHHLCSAGEKWYGWVTVKEYDEGSDSDFALSQAEELLEFLNQ